MATAKNKPQSPAEGNIQVNNLGDVTESKAELAPQVLGELLPLADLPAGYEVLATRHPEAKGYTLEGGSVALHF